MLRLLPIEKWKAKLTISLIKKIEEEIFELEEKESKKNYIIIVNLNESDKRVNEEIKKDDLNKVQEVLEKIAPGSTQLISNPEIRSIYRQEIKASQN